jgi:peptidoglycan hydrolase-like protein with peptidoglycan-binding domain
MIAQSTAPDVRELVSQLETLSLDKAGDQHTLPLTVDEATGPVLAWYIREFQDVTTVEGLSAPPDTVAAVTLVLQDPPIGETFRGRGFPLHTHWSPWGLGGQSLVRWLLFTDGSLPIVDQEVVLWVASQS